MELGPGLMSSIYDGIQRPLVQIKEKSGTPGPKIVVMTGSIDAVDAVKARRLGADDYCVKTNDAVTFIEVIKRFES